MTNEIKDLRLLAQECRAWARFEREEPGGSPEIAKMLKRVARKLDAIAKRLSAPASPSSP
jgi:hypothetical protein